MKQLFMFPKGRVYQLSDKPHITVLKQADELKFWYGRNECCPTDELMDAMVGYLTREFSSVIVDTSSAACGLIVVHVDPMLLIQHSYLTVTNQICGVVRATLRSACTFCEDYDANYADMLNNDFFHIGPA